MNKSRQPFIWLITALFWFTCQSFLSGGAWAGEVFPETTWESAPMSGALYSAAAGLCPERCLALVYKDKIALMRIGKRSEVLSPMAEVNAEATESFHRVHLGDFDADGVTDILVNGFQEERVFSRWFNWQDGHLVKKQDFVATVMPLWWQGKMRLFSQTLRGRGEWSQTLKEISLDAKSAPKKSERIRLRLATGIGSNPIGLFALQSMDERLVSLSEEGILILSDGLGKRLWRSGLKYGGAVDRIALEGRDPMGVKQDQILMLPPRLAYHAHSAALYVAKNSGFLPAAIGAFPDMKATEYVVLKATTNGLQETFVSRRFDGAISDLNLVDFDGDGRKNEVLIVLWIRTGGLLESAQPVSSRVVVVAAGDEAPVTRHSGRGK